MEVRYEGGDHSNFGHDYSEIKFRVNCHEAIIESDTESEIEEKGEPHLIKEKTDQLLTPPPKTKRNSKKRRAKRRNRRTAKQLAAAEPTAIIPTVPAAKTQREDDSDTDDLSELIEYIDSDNDTDDKTDVPFGYKAQRKSSTHVNPPRPTSNLTTIRRLESNRSYPNLGVENEAKEEYECARATPFGALMLDGTLRRAQEPPISWVPEILELRTRTGMRIPAHWPDLEILELGARTATRTPPPPLPLQLPTGHAKKKCS